MKTPAEGVTHTRTFTYDNHGYILSDTQPEMGIQGNKTTYYQATDGGGNLISGYDSRGNVGIKRVDGASKFTHDARMPKIGVAGGGSGTAGPTESVMLPTFPPVVPSVPGPVLSLLSIPSKVKLLLRGR